MRVRNPQPSSHSAKLLGTVAVGLTLAGKTIAAVFKGELMPGRKSDTPKVGLQQVGFLAAKFSV